MSILLTLCQTIHDIISIHIQCKVRISLTKDLQVPSRLCDVSSFQRNWLIARGDRDVITLDLANRKHLVDI